MSIFKETVSIVREAERLVIGTRIKTQWRHAESALDAIVHVPWFILVGLQEKIASFALALALIPAWWAVLFIVLLITSGSPAANLQSSQGWVVAALLAAGSVIFRLPSHFTHLGIRPKQTTQLAAHIRSIASDEATIKLLQSGISVMDAVNSQRITRINWILGVCWAGLVWAASHWVFSTVVSDALKHEAFPRIFGGFLIFLFFGVGASSYETTIRMVKQTIDFALLEASDTRCSE
ncbi:hypothetical protein [Dyella subtropica]|uniref:hypothetical protein n=1 Tax=Dyella subtropica TaxID=2992127 RepID=UPI00225C422E|nr:hypothetical protein [Dyella subtropica]